MLYIILDDINADWAVGVKKKILGQANAFSKAFKDCYYTVHSAGMIYLCLNEKVIEKEFALTVVECKTAIIRWIEQYNFKQVYIRYFLASKTFIDLLEYLKSNKIKAVLEFMTIPYDYEGCFKSSELLEDIYYRDQLHEYLDCCTTYCQMDSVFGISCIPLVNGIDVDTLGMKKVNKNKNDITLIGVASMVRAHGYERVIQGLNEYYKLDVDRKIYFKLVGEGSQSSYYKYLTEKFGLENYVEFCGILTGKRLDEAYDESDIGVCALGTYKNNIDNGIGIKACEYFAKGLPIIHCSSDKIIEDKYYCMKIANDKSYLNINDVIVFYDNIQDKDYMYEIRNYCIENYSWEKILEPVVKYYKEG